MDSNSRDERRSPFLPYADIVQEAYRPEISEMQRSKWIEGGKAVPPHSPKHKEDVSEALKGQASISAMLQSTKKLSYRTHGSGTSLWHVHNRDDCHLDTGSKSDQMAQLKEMVSRLKNALISLEEENLLLNKKVKESIAAQKAVDCGSPGSKPKTISEASVTDHTPKERQVVHPLNADVQQKTCEREDTPCYHQQSEDRYFPPGEEKQDVHKKLKKMEAFCKECTNELGRVLRKYEELRARNKAVEKYCKVLTSEHQGLAKSLREEQAVLETCLCTVQKERDLLQQELRKLHQDYLELSGTISLQLRTNNSSRPSTSPGPPDPPNFSSVFTGQDKVIGRFLFNN